MNNCPDNLLVIAPHGSYTSPESLEPNIDPKFKSRLRKNFSDFLTAYLIGDIPEGQRVIPAHGRIAGDPARALNAPDLFRETDFNDIPVYSNHLPADVREAALDQSYRPFHAEVLRQLKAQHGDARNTLVAFDLHDTGNLLLGYTPEQDETREKKKGWRMPPVIISNKDGLTAPNELMEDLREAFAHHLRLSSQDVKINDPYKGGYVTAHYGDPSNPELQNAAHERRAIVQVELDRGLYMDEQTQGMIPSKINDVRRRLTRVFTEVADGRTYYAK